jgi:hypothetical protein
MVVVRPPAVAFQGRAEMAFFLGWSVDFAWTVHWLTIAS